MPCFPSIPEELENFAVRHCIEADWQNDRDQSSTRGARSGATTTRNPLPFPTPRSTTSGRTSRASSPTGT